MSEPFARDIDSPNGFSDRIYLTGYSEAPPTPDDRTWCRVSLTGTTALVPSTGQPLPPPIVLESADAVDLEYEATPDVDMSSDGFWYYNSETWPGQPVQGILLNDGADVGQDLFVWFTCLDVLPLQPMP